MKIKRKKSGFFLFFIYVFQILDVPMKTKAVGIMQKNGKQRLQEIGCELNTSVY
jgi:hypothetical protein